MRLATVGSVLLILGTVTALSAAPSTSEGGATPAKLPPKVQLTREEMRSRAAAFEGQIDDDFRHINVVQQKAHKKADVVKVNCVNDKLVQAKAQMNIAQAAKGDLTSALEPSVADSERNGAFDKYSSSAEGIHTLRGEADECLGETELYKQEAGVEVQKPDITDDPTGDDPYDPGSVEVEPPTTASTPM